MDAKPQRPVRSVRIRNDENLAPTMPMNKTIHQRNKSSPALSTMLGAGGLKAAAKRTAFGDVSNAANGINLARSSKDDNSLPIKDRTEAMEKPFNILQDKKSAALLRPAQRPLGPPAPKIAIGPANTAKDPDTAIPRASIETVPLPQAANARKILTKKNTAVFIDQPVDETVAKPAKVNAPAISCAPVHQTLAAPDTKPPQQSLLPLVSTIPGLRVSKEPLPDSSDPAIHDEKHHAVTIPSDGFADLRSDGVYLDTKGDVQVYDNHSSLHPHQDPAPIADPVRAASKLSSRSTLNEMPATKPVVPSHSADHAPLRYSHLPPLSEPEEYWDDEEEDNYDEEGYVTARSYRSRGENTTGAATTILFPKVNQKVRRELAAAKQLVEATRTAEDIEDECYDTSMVAEYGDEIFGYMRELEIKMLPNAHYMDNQAEIQWSMRSVLMDWLVQVHGRFSLLPETLFLCVNYIDRFLSCKIVSLGKLQLVGATAIFIAAKYEEINCPSVQEVVYMVDGGYTIDEILKAERFMLSMLQFELGWPGPMSFLRRISKADDYDLETRTLAKYFLEITIMDERFVGSPPSFAAAGAHCLARMMLKKGTWTPAHAYYSGYTYSQLHPLVSLILECCEQPLKHHNAVYDKYSDKRYKRASFFVDTEMKKGFKLPGTTRALASSNTIDFLDECASWPRA